VLISVAILFFVTLIIYGLIRALPTSYVETMAIQLSSKPGAKSYTEWLEQLNAAYGFDQPVLVGYFGWLK
jgi:peptide/nickel transport system permease protein